MTGFFHFAFTLILGILLLHGPLHDSPWILRPNRSTSAATVEKWSVFSGPALPGFAWANLAGQEGLEPPPRGFGDRCSTNWSYWPLQFLLTLPTILRRLTPPILLQGPKPLLNFLVQTMLSAKLTKLFKLQFVRILFLILS